MQRISLAMPLVTLSLGWFSLLFIIGSHVSSSSTVVGVTAVCHEGALEQSARQLDTQTKLTGPSSLGSVQGPVAGGQLLHVGGGRPALGAVVAGEPDIPPASTAYLDQLHHLALVQVDLSGGEGGVVSQDFVLGEGGAGGVHEVSLARTPVMVRVQ